MTDSSKCAHVDDHNQCTKPVTHERPLCYQHWKEFDSFIVVECKKCHRFSSDVNDYSVVRGFAEAVDWCYECFDRKKRGFPEAGVHEHGIVEHQTRYLYILKMDGGNFYVGQTNSLELRLEEHQDGTTKSTVGRNPKLVWFEEWTDTREALNDREDSLTILNRTNPRALRRMIHEWNRLLKLVDFEA